MKVYIGLFTAQNYNTFSIIKSVFESKNPLIISNLCYICIYTYKSIAILF